MRHNGNGTVNSHSCSSQVNEKWNISIIKYKLRIEVSHDLILIDRTENQIMEGK